MSQTGTGSILVVDDEEPIRTLFRTLLEVEGYRVTTALTAREARDHLARCRFDVLLADLLLPEEDGLALLRFAIEQDGEMSVVMVTGHPDISTAIEALKQGAYDYLSKPVGRQSLLAAVERARERKHLVAEKRRLEAENAEYQKCLERKVEERTEALRDSERRHRELFEETRRAYEDLRSAQARLVRSERLAAVGELAACIAHEIRNPLGAISNSVGLLRRDLQLEGDDRRLLEVVYEESQRLARIVDDFLKYARPRPVEKSPVVLAEVFEDLLLLLSRDQRVGGGLSIQSNHDGNLPRVEADASQIREALWNLLSNAVEAMPQGGTLRVETRRADGGAPAVELVVSDTGRGVPVEEQEKIFLPFHTTKANGTGLGLAIVQRIVEGHGGSIHLESAPGRGASFVLRLPLTSHDKGLPR